MSARLPPAQEGTPRAGGLSTGGQNKENAGPGFGDPAGPVQLGPGFGDPAGPVQKLSQYVLLCVCRCRSEMMRFFFDPKERARKKAAGCDRA